MSVRTEPPAERHRDVAARFGEVVAGVTAWDAPAPVEGWVARDVVDHLVDWVRPLLAGGAGIELPSGPAVADDPAGAWAAHGAAVQALLDDPATQERILRNPYIGEMPVPTAIDMIYTTDVFMHTWDLARASGQEPALDQDECARLLVGIEPMDDVLRASGQYGPKVPVPDDADVQTRLVGFIGRRPDWAPALPTRP